MLIRNDIIGPEKISSNIAGQTAFISSCGVRISIDAKQRGHVVRRKVLSASPVVLPPQSEMAVPVNSTSLPDDRDFLFQPVSLPHLTLFAHLVDSSLIAILVRNKTHRHAVLPRKQKIGAFVEILYDNCFQADLTFSAAKQPPSNPPLHESRSGVTVPSANPSQETPLPNGIRVFGDATAVAKISSLVNEFPSIWESSGFVRIPLECWMTVPL